MNCLFGILILSTLVMSGSASSYWTSWLDRDNYSGSGDWELYGQFVTTPCTAGYKPVAANCRVKGSNIPWYEGNQVIQSCNQCTPRGFVCKNSDQPGFVNCLDYEVRFLCYHP